MKSTKPQNCTNCERAAAIYDGLCNDCSRIRQIGWDIGYLEGLEDGKN